MSLVRNGLIGAFVGAVSLTIIVWIIFIFLALTGLFEDEFMGFFPVRTIPSGALLGFSFWIATQLAGRNRRLAGLVATGGGMLCSLLSALWLLLFFTRSPVVRLDDVIILLVIEGAINLSAVLLIGFGGSLLKAKAV